MAHGVELIGAFAKRSHEQLGDMMEWLPGAAAGAGVLSQEGRQEYDRLQGAVLRFYGALIACRLLLEHDLMEEIEETKAQAVP